MTSYPAFDNLNLMAGQRDANRTVSRQRHGDRQISGLVADLYATTLDLDSLLRWRKVAGDAAVARQPAGPSDATAAPRTPT